MHESKSTVFERFKATNSVENKKRNGTKGAFSDREKKFV